MAKQKKKRNKAYRGSDAAVTRPVITKISAINRSKLGQFWFDRKRILKPALIAAGVVLLLVLLVSQIIRLASGS